MSQTEDLGSFLKQSKPLLKEYLETRAEIFRLQAVRMVSQSAGYLVWILVSVFLVFLILLFSGLVLGFWLSGLFHSHVQGFGLTTLVLIAIFALLAVLRRQLFVEPLTERIIQKTNDTTEASAGPSVE